MKNGFKRIAFSTVLSGALLASTMTPVTRVKAETKVKIENKYNKYVDVELYKVLPVEEAIAWSMQTYGECHVVVKELPTNSGRFVYAINNGAYVQGWSSVPDENIHGFTHLNTTTGGFALCIDYYENQLPEEYVKAVLKEKEEKEKIEKEQAEKERLEKEEQERIEKEQKDKENALTNRIKELKTKLGKVILGEIDFERKDEALRIAYEKVEEAQEDEEVGFALFTRKIMNPRNNKEITMYAISEDYYVEHWEAIGNDKIPSNANVFMNINSAEKYELACISNDKKDSKKFKKIKYTN